MFTGKLYKHTLELSALLKVCSCSNVWLSSEPKQSFSKPTPFNPVNKVEDSFKVTTEQTYSKDINIGFQ